MEIEFAETALNDLKFWKSSGNISVQKKISTLLENIKLTPFSGIGKPELLKNNLQAVGVHGLIRSIE